LTGLPHGLGLLEIVDILLVAAFLYKLFAILRDTRAVVLIRGLAIILIIGAISQTMGFRTIAWLFERSLTLLLVALPIVFYPELRRALEQIGKGELLRTTRVTEKELQSHLIREVVRAATNMSQKNIGALIVFQREIRLGEYLETGVRLDAQPSRELFQNIFMPLAPLHDGAVIIGQGRVLAAGCVLPLTEQRLASHLGTRHRAAVGISEATDALAVVVSEETGFISLAVGGRLERPLAGEALEAKLEDLLTARYSFARKDQGWA
jgi:diadenylate cyclase